MYVCGLNTLGPWSWLQQTEKTVCCLNTWSNVKFYWLVGGCLQKNQVTELRLLSVLHWLELIHIFHIFSKQKIFWSFWFGCMILRNVSSPEPTWWCFGGLQHQISVLRYVSMISVKVALRKEEILSRRWQLKKKIQCLAARNLGPLQLVFGKRLQWIGLVWVCLAGGLKIWSHGAWSDDDGQHNIGKNHE